MLRKGVVEHIGAIMLVVISAAAIGGTMSSIQSHTVEPSQQGLMDQLQAYNQEATIENEEQFRGLVVWNMMAAQQCLYNPVLFNWEDEDIEDRLNMELVDKSKDEGLDINPKEFTYYGKGEDGDILGQLFEETDFQGTCLGASPISIFDPIDQVLEELPDVINDVGVVELEGHSAQGRFGIVDFTVEETMRIEDEELMAIHLSDELVDSGWGGLNAPDFIRGERAAVFQPEGILRTDASEQKYGEKVGFTQPDKKSAQMLPHLGEEHSDTTEAASKGTNIYPYNDNDVADWREAMNAFRVRMVNVPTVTTGEFNYDDLQSFEDEKWRQQYRYVVQNTDYIICEGASGFVQSNAGRDIEESGKEYSDDNPIYRDVIYPRVELRNQGDCLDDAIAYGSYDAIAYGSYDAMGDRLRMHNEDFPTRSEPLYTSPSIDDLYDRDGTYSVDEQGEIRIGEDKHLTVYSVLTQRNARSLDLSNWWDIGNEQDDSLYRLEYGFSDGDVCDSNDFYDITKLHHEAGNTVFDEETSSYSIRNTDENEAVHYIERFGEGSTFRTDIDIDVSGGEGIILKYFDTEGNEWGRVVLTSDSVSAEIPHEGGSTAEHQSIDSDSNNYQIDFEMNEAIHRINIHEDGRNEQAPDLSVSTDDTENELHQLEKVALEVFGEGEATVNQMDVIGKPKGCN